MLKIVKLLIQSCILFIRSLLGFRRGGSGRPSFCIYPIGCTEYALRILEQKSLLKAPFLITKRLLTCNPIGAWFLYR
ncbi:membrane protein insertion efficiency factor YidD [Candidatus Babeliales bacterium]|nr:membrane protein insertion efficiency factor YidD [Candidatus Babeliales bacterium]